jgi:hypothetical protein
MPAKRAAGITDPACTDVSRGRSLQPLAAYGALVDWAIQERELAILHVLDRIGTPGRSDVPLRVVAGDAGVVRLTALMR